MVRIIIIMKVLKKCKNWFIDKNNKIWDYIKFNTKDRVIWEYIDYLAFYGTRNRKYLLNFLRSDNWGAFFYKMFTIKPDSLDHFQAKIFYSYMWIAVDMFQIKEITIGNQMYLKVDLYWKWLKLIREQWLRIDFYSFLSEVLCMKDIILTRADYTVDCAKYNFRKVNSLSNKVSWSICSQWNRDRDLDDLNWRVERFNESNKDKKKVVQYKLFWKKSSSSSRFIRYYDKKAEILARGTSFLYPEYFGYDQIMRYELQVNSKWFDSVERCMDIKDVEAFINFGYCVSSSKWSHVKKRDETILQWCLRGIRKLKRDWYLEDLEKLKLALFDYQDLELINNK